MPRLRRRAARRRRREARGACSRCSRRRGSSTRCAALGKLKSIADSMPKEVSKAPCQEVVLTGDDVDLDLLPDPALLAARPRAVHHAAGRDHEGPRDRRPQRRHVPDAEDRPPLDVHALADPQGRPRRPARRARRPHPGRGRDRARPGHRLLRERAAAEAHRRADGGRLPQGLGRSQLVQVQDGRPRGARERRDRARGLGRRGRRRRSKGPFGDHTGFYTPAEEFPIFRITRHDDAARRDLSRRSSSASRRPRTSGSPRRPSASSCRRSG